MAALLVGAEDADAISADGFDFDKGSVGSLAGIPAGLAFARPVHTVRFVAQVGPSASPGGSLDALFKRGGLLGGFAAGFLGSGLLGLLFGRGLLSGLDGVASYLGLIFQIALIVMLVRLIWTRWRAGDSSGFSAPSSRQLADAYLRSRSDLHPGGSSFGGDMVEPETRPSSAETAENSAPDK